MSTPMSALEVNELRKTYSGNVIALKGVSFSVEKGDFFGLLGPNGAGKSTLIGIITSLVNKSSGSVSIFGYDTERSPALAKSCIGLVPQEFNFSLFEKVLQIVVNQAGYYGVPRIIAVQRAEKYLKALDLWDKRHAVSRTLSGGMKRRLMIARALMHEPQLLILDEPTAGVDIEVRRSLWLFLKQLNEEQGITIILTTHYLEEAESLCKNIAIIDKGQLIENTNIKNLLRKLDKQYLVLDLESPMVFSPELNGFSFNLIDPTTLEVGFGTDQSLNDLFALFNSTGIRIASLRNKTNRLEELFVNLVKDHVHADLPHDLGPTKGTMT
jgi:ABC-2 type transport system ATP-binding protein